jgi:outer membrane protein TolC
MKSKKKKALWVIGKRCASSIILLLAGLSLPALAGDEPSLTLDQAIQIALQRNPDILLAQKNVIMATGKTLQMKAVSDPSLVFRDEGLSSKKTPPRKAKS